MRRREIPVKINPGARLLASLLCTVFVMHDVRCRHIDRPLGRVGPAQGHLRDSGFGFVNFAFMMTLGRTGITRWFSGGESKEGTLLTTIYHGWGFCRIRLPEIVPQ